MYVDRLIDGGNLAPIIAQDLDGPTDSSGFPRQLSVTARGTTQTNPDAAKVAFRDIQINGQIDTPHYGAWSVALTHRDTPRTLFGRVDQRAMPFANGWQLDNAWGMVTTVGERVVAGSLARYTLPTTPIFGMQSAWSNPQLGQSFALAVGERYQAGDELGSGFQRLGGRFVSASATAQLLPTLRAALSVISAAESAESHPLKLRGDSAFGSLGWNVGNTVVEANVIASRQPDGAHTGVWIGAQRVDGPFTQRVSGFRFDRDLMWGSAASVADIEGVGYRVAYRSRVVNTDASAELFRPLSEPKDWGLYSTGSARYQVSRFWGVGGNVAIRVQRGVAHTLRGYVDYANDLGQTQVQTSVERSADEGTRTLIGLDHSFASLPAFTSARLTVSGSVEHQKIPLMGSLDWLNTGAVLGYDFPGEISLDATLRSRNNLSGSLSRSLDAAANISWKFSPGWSLSASVGQSRGRFELPPSLDPLQPIVSPLQRASSRYVFASVTYRYAAGSANAPLGGRVGGAAGSVNGVVFFDDNENGRRDANEVGAANIVVLLDGRFTTRTDAQGRFEFALVGSGEHKITVPPENLPLPWTIIVPTLSVRVETRATSSVNIAATRTR